MSDVAVTVQVPAAIKDLSDLLVGVIADVKAGKPLSQTVADSLVGALKLAGEFAEIGAEVQDVQLDIGLGLLLGSLSQALRAKPAVVAAPAAPAPAPAT